MNEWMDINKQVDEKEATQIHTCVHAIHTGHQGATDLQIHAKLTIKKSQQVL